jgi:putative tricarboxylic transport membrane protein
MRLLGITLALVAAVCLYEARRLSFAEDYTIGPGAAPIVYAAVLFVLGLWAALRRGRTEAESAAPVAPSALGMLALTAAMALAFEWLGLVISLFVFAVVGFRLLTGMGTLRATTAAVTLVAGFYMVFVFGLNVPLPRGELLPAITSVFANG